MLGETGSMKVTSSKHPLKAAKRTPKVTCSLLGPSNSAFEPGTVERVPFADFYQADLFTVQAL